jgi:hypothetical protein
MQHVFQLINENINFGTSMQQNIIQWLKSSLRNGGYMKCLLLHERGEAARSTYYMISTVWNWGKSKTTETIKIWVVTRGQGWKKFTNKCNIKHL